MKIYVDSVSFTTSVLTMRNPEGSITVNFIQFKKICTQ